MRTSTLEARAARGLMDGGGGGGGGRCVCAGPWHCVSFHSHLLPTHAGDVGSSPKVVASGWSRSRSCAPWRQTVMVIVVDVSMDKSVSALPLPFTSSMEEEE